MLFDGKWCSPQTTGVHENCNPTTGELLGFVPEATKDEVNNAVQIAEQAFWQWRQVPTDIRMKFGLRIAELIEEQREKLVKNMATEMGKTRFDANLDVNEAVGVTQVVAPMAVSMTGKAYTNIVVNLTMESRVEPRGVVALVTPFNFPIAIPTAHIVAALMTGNMVVWKPAPEVPESSQALATLILQAMEDTERRYKTRLPRGIFNMVLGDASTGEALICHPAVQIVSFTGSKVVGDYSGQHCKRVRQKKSSKKLEASTNTTLTKPLICTPLLFKSFTLKLSPTVKGALPFKRHWCTNEFTMLL